MSTRVEPADPRLDTVPERIDQLGDAPWPPNFAKQPGEPKRVQPSRAKQEA